MVVKHIAKVVLCLVNWPSYVLLALTSVLHQSILLHLVIEVFQILLAHQVVLFGRQASIFEEVTQNSLEINDDYRSLHLVHPSLEGVSVRSLEVFGSRWKKMHFQVVLILANLLLFLR